MKFEEMEYKRPDADYLIGEIKKSIEDFKLVNNAEGQLKVIDKLDGIYNEFESMAVLASIRHSIDTNDKFYEGENGYLAEIGPKIQEFSSEFNEYLIKSEFRVELEKVKGKLMFQKIETELKTFKPEIIEDLVEENKLDIEYGKLIGSAQVKWNGENLTLAQLAPYMQNEDRNVRKSASELYYGFMAGNEPKFDEIYDKLVKVRTKIAKILGFENFVELGYLRMGRIDYNKDMVEVYRKQIFEEAVEYSVELKKRQAKRINLDKLKYYDNGFMFKSGNPKPKGNPEWIVEKGIKMYDELSKETSEFFRFMKDNNLLDLVAKKGKRPGGYCTFIPKYESPFIFSNFNGTQGDVEVLTHEVGHAFQVYSSRNLDSSYRWPTYEAAEIHSMSMEYLTYPWMNEFFLEDTEKFEFSHMSGNIQFLPYGATVDEFQHWVYENPEVSPKGRRDAWKKIEKKYKPDLDYDGNKYLEEGGFWQKQGHIYSVPFYYIDYTLASICAMQFYKKSTENREEAWKNYVELCKLGGSKTFLGLLQSSGLKSPFEEGTIKEVLDVIKNKLDKINDMEF